MITAFPLEQAPGSRPGAEPIGCWVTLSDLVPLPGSFAVWQLAGSRARRQGAFFSFGARVAGPGPRFCSAPFSHSAPAPTPNKVLCFAHFSQHSPLSSPQHLSVSRLPFESRTLLRAPPPRGQKVKLPTLTGVCSQAGDVIESSRPVPMRRGEWRD